jgi:hypothetical protein
VPQATPKPLDEFQYLPLVARNYSPLVIPDTTKPLSESTTQYLDSVSPNGAVFTFSQKTPELESVEPGDIIAGGVTDATPYGFLRRVTNVSTTGTSASAQASQVVFTTEQATLEEAIEEGTIHESKCFEQKVIPIDEDLYEGEDGAVELKGHVIVQPCFDFTAVIDGHHLEEVTFINTTVQTATLELTADIEKSIQEDRELVPVTLPTIPIPVGVIVPVLSVHVGLSGTVEAGLSTGLTQTATLTASVTYDDDEGWSKIADYENRFYPDTPTFSGTLDLKAYTGPRLTLWINGVVAPYAEIDGYLRLHADVNTTPWWQLYGGLDAKVGAKAEILGWTLLDYEPLPWRLYEELLAQAEGTPNLVSNPGFEQQLVGWNTSSGSAMYVAETQFVHLGSYSAKGVETSSGSLGRLYQDVTNKVTPGQTYKIIGWIKTEGVSGQVVIALDYVMSSGWTPADGYVKEIGFVSGTQDWTYYESIPFTLPEMPSDASALWFLLDFNAGAGTAYWDDLALEPY